MANTLVEPNPGVRVAPSVESTNPAPEAQTAADIPEEVVQIPAMQGLLSGQPAAVSVPIKGFESRPEGKVIVANKDALMQAGIGFYTSLGGDIGAIFNRMFLADQEIQAADKEGRLTEVAPPMDQVNQMISQSGEQNPVLQSGERPASFKSAGPAAPTPGPVANMAPAPAPGASPNKTPAKVVAAKQRNLNPGSPTSGPKPGAGRLLNQILKPVL